jgi:hypothetical protein
MPIDLCVEANNKADGLWPMPYILERSLEEHQELPIAQQSPNEQSKGNPEEQSEEGNHCVDDGDIILECLLQSEE